MVKINNELARDILANLECSGTECADCLLGDKECEKNHAHCVAHLRDAIAAAERSGDNVQETELLRDPPAPVKPEMASKYITIAVAEYHCLTKAATMLEVILADDTYNHAEIVAAVKKTVQEMQRAAGAGADQ